jgi:hypothetical protein
MAKDLLANAYGGMFLSQFLARMSAATVTLEGFVIAKNPMAGEVICFGLRGRTQCHWRQ